jgi:hypothetical protein
MDGSDDRRLLICGSLARKPAIDNPRVAKGDQPNNWEVKGNCPVEAVQMEDLVSLKEGVGT